MSPKSDSEFQSLQRLMHLKRHEHPPAAFTDEFLVAFRDRQRREMLNHSARGLLWERVGTWWNDQTVPKWGIGVAGAAACLALMWLMVPASTTPKLVSNGESTTNMREPFLIDSTLISVGDEDELGSDPAVFLSRHFSGGYADEARRAQGHWSAPDAAR